MHLNAIRKRSLQLAGREEEDGSGYSGELLGCKGGTGEVSGSMGALMVTHSRFGRLPIFLQKCEVGCQKR